MLPNRRTFWLSTALTTAAVAALFALSSVRKAPVSHDRAWPASVREAATHNALEWRAGASVVALAAHAQAAWLGSSEAVEDEARLIEVCERLAVAGRALVADFHGRAAFLAPGGIDPAVVEQLLRASLKADLPRGRDGSGPSDDLLPFPALPLQSSILSAPALAPPTSVLERILERLLQALQRLLQILPPGSPAIAAVQRAIAAIEAVLGTTDTTAPVLQNLAPAPGSLTSQARPTLSGTVIDTGGSGVDTASIRVQLDGVDVPATLSAISPDQASFSFVPAAPLADGSHTVEAFASDRAGNAAVPASTFFIVDTTPPGLQITSPPQGGTLGSLSVPFSGTISDAGGLPADPFSLRLNGVDVTSQVTATVGSTSPQGRPTQVQLAGTLTAIEGSNLLSLQASDAALNASASEVAFTVSLSPPPPPPPPSEFPEFGIALVSGDGQAGAAGRCVDDPLKVRITDARTGLPVEGMAVTHVVTEGGGDIGAPPSLTGADGLSSVRFRLGLRPGANRIRSFVAGLPDGPSVEFVLQGQAPKILLPQVSGFLLEEYEGSGLPTTLAPTVQDANGTPLAGVELFPQVVDAAGTPLPDGGGLGRFHPSRALTGADGRARFAVELLDGAPTGTFQIRFTLTDFFDADGKPIASSTMDVTVRDPSFRAFDLTSGQGQKVLPDEVASRKLEVKFVFPPGIPAPGPNDQFTAVFEILEGGGSLLPGGAAEDGEFTPFTTSPSGGVTAGLIKTAPGSTVGRIRYRKGSENVPALVRIGGTDIWIFTGPEAFFVDVFGTRVDRPHARPPEAFSSADLLRLRVLAPLDAPGPTARLESLDGCFDPRGDDGQGVGETSADLGTLSMGGSPEPERYAVWDSDDLLVTSEVIAPAALPSGPRLVHVLPGQALRGATQVKALGVPTRDTTVEGILLLTADPALGGPNIGTDLVATLRGVPDLAGKSLTFLADGVAVGQAATDAGGTAVLHLDLPENAERRLEARDEASRAGSFTIALLRTPFQSQGGQDRFLTQPAHGDETKERVDFFISKSATAAARLKAFKSKLKGDDYELVPSETELIDARVGGYTGFEKSSGKYIVRLRKTRSPVQTAIHVSHELNHVEEDETLRARALRDIQVNAVAGATKPKIVEYAAKALLRQKFGTAAQGGEEAFRVFYAKEMEQPAYAAMLKTQKEIAAAVGNGFVLDNDGQELNDDLLKAGANVAERAPLEGADLTKAVRNRTDARADAKRRVLVVAWDNIARDIPEGAIPEVAKLLQRTTNDASFERLLLLLGWNPDLIPPDLKDR
jgi:hypothetical protein